MANPTITDLPPVPTRNDAPAVFVDKADAFLGALPQFQAEANALGAAVEADTAQTAADRVQTGLDRASATASASSALNAPGTNGASATSLLIGTGTKVFVTQSGKAWSVGQGVVAASAANPLNQMIGTITAYSGTSLTVSVSSVGGSGTFADWVISMAAGAALAMASQAEAEAGADNTKVMTPLRTAQAISAQATMKGATINTATTLTVSSAYSQVVIMPTIGLPITLPAANTLVNGPRFAISNTGTFDLPIKNSAGVTKAFVRPSATAICVCVDNTTTAGVWVFDNAAFLGMTAELHAPYSGMYGNNTSAVTIALDVDRDLILYDSSLGTRGVIYNKTIQAWGGVTSINVYNPCAFKAALVSAGVVLFVSNNSATPGNLEAKVISTSGTTITVNAAVQANSLGSSAVTATAINLVGTTWVVNWTLANAPASGVVALTVSGTTPTFGTPVNDGRGQVTTINYTQVVGSVLVNFIVYNGSGSMYAEAWTFSGTASTQGSATSWAATAGQVFKVEQLTNGKWVVVSPVTGNYYAVAVSLSGTTLSSGPPLGLGNIAANIEGDMALAPIAPNKLAFLLCNLNGATFNILAESSLTLTAGSPINKAVGSSTPAWVGWITTIGTDVYFAWESSTILQVARVSCSATSPSFVYGQYVSMDAGRMSTEIPKQISPRGGPWIYNGRGYLRGAAGYTTPPRSAAQGVVFGPYARLYTADLDIHMMTVPGSTASESWMISVPSSPANQTVFKKVEMAL